MKKTAGYFTELRHAERAVWLMRDAGMTWATIKEATGLPSCAVSRILKGRRPYGTGKKAA